VRLLTAYSIRQVYEPEVQSDAGVAVGHVNEHSRATMNSAAWDVDASRSTRCDMRICTVLLMTTTIVCSARADVVLTPAITPSGGDLSYNYTVTNTEPLGIVAIDLSIPVAPTSVSAPPDWTTNTFADVSGFVVQWFSASSEIAPGTSLSDFILVAPGVSGTVAFTATDADLQTLTGTTTGPVDTTVIPEPATFWFLPVGIAGFVILRYRRI
jgi:hypothetical protein